MGRDKGSSGLETGMMAGESEVWGTRVDRRLTQLEAAYDRLPVDITRPDNKAGEARSLAERAGDLARENAPSPKFRHEEGAGGTVAEDTIHNHERRLRTLEHHSRLDRTTPQTNAREFQARMQALPCAVALWGSADGTTEIAVQKRTKRTADWMARWILARPGDPARTVDELLGLAESVRSSVDSVSGIDDILADDSRHQPRAPVGMEGLETVSGRAIMEGATLADSPEQPEEEPNCGVPGDGLADPVVVTGLRYPADGRLDELVALIIGEPKDADAEERYRLRIAKLKASINADLASADGPLLDNWPDEALARLLLDLVGVLNKRGVSPRHIHRSWRELFDILAIGTIAEEIATELKGPAAAHAVSFIGGVAARVREKAEKIKRLVDGIADDLEDSLIPEEPHKPLNVRMGDSETVDPAATAERCAEALKRAGPPTARALDEHEEDGNTRC